MSPARDMPAARILSASGDLAGVGLASRPTRRTGHVAVDPESVERGLAQLVLTLIELLRQLMERQAVARMEQGSLDDDEIERLGDTFMKLADRMNELKAAFDLADEDLNLDLGPLGRLL
jgi:gas vesicle protein GvpK